MLDVLRNGRVRRFRLNEEVLGYLASAPLSKATRNWLAAKCSNQLGRASLVERLDTKWPDLSVQQRRAILSAAAVAAYHAEEGIPRVRLLLVMLFGLLNASSLAGVVQEVNQDAVLCAILDLGLLDEKEGSPFRRECSGQQHGIEAIPFEDSLSVRTAWMR